MLSFCFRFDVLDVVVVVVVVVVVLHVSSAKPYYYEYRICYWCS